jgi:chromosome partitioning protein
MGSGIDKRALDLSVYDVLLENAGIAEVRQTSPKGGYDVVGANRELAGAEVELVGSNGATDACARRWPRCRRLRLRAHRLPAEPEPAHAQRLSSAHGVVVPMQCEYFALEGLSDLVNTIKQVHANLNPSSR